MRAKLFLANTAEAVETGPLESTIVSLSKEIEKKGVEGKELQRRWITKQTELVALQVSKPRSGDSWSYFLNLCSVAQSYLVAFNYGRVSFWLRPVCGLMHSLPRAR